MKNNIFRLAFVATLFFVSACENTELGLLDNPNEVTPDKADINLVYNNVVLNFGSFVWNVNAETRPYVRQVAMTGGNFYRSQDAPESFDNDWSLAYATLIPDLDLIIAQGQERGLTVHVGSAKIMKAYIFFTLVDMFGDVPFSEANKGVSVISPKADKGADVYKAAIALLDEAIKDLQSPVGKPTNDLFYNGDATKWIKLANTLKLRAYLQTRLVDNSAKSQIDAIISGGNIISSSSDDFQFQYSSNRLNPDSRHPDYAGNYETGAGTYQSNYYMWLFFGEKSVVDPRIRFYFYRQDGDTTDENLFTLDCPNIPKPSHYPEFMPFCVASTSGYWGRDHGNADGIPPDTDKRTNFGVYPAGGAFDDDSFEGNARANGTAGAKGAGMQPIMLSSWVDFMLAEAALTLGTAGDPRALLESAVRKSISKTISYSKSILTIPAAFEPTAADIDAYVAEVLSLYDAAPTTADKLDVIIKEYHLALWGNGIDAYNNYRRTGSPKGMQPTREANIDDFARSLWYPANFVNRNANANQKPNVSVQVFWDNNPAGFVK